MKTFTDTADRTWTVAITVDAVKRVRALAGVDLLEAAGGKLLARLADDPVLLADVLYAVVKPEAEAKGVSDEDFGRSLAGDAIDRATAAFLEDLVDFFPRRRRGVLRKALEKANALDAAASQAASDALDSPLLEQEIRRRLTPEALAEHLRRELSAETSGGPSTSPPGPPGSLPDS